MGIPFDGLSLFKLGGKQNGMALSRAFDQAEKRPHVSLI